VAALAPRFGQRDIITVFSPYLTAISRKPSQAPKTGSYIRTKEEQNKEVASG
jgi:hypothetical protein